MDWTLVGSIVAIILGLILWHKVTSYVPPTPEQLQLKKWRQIAHDLAWKHRLTDKTRMPHGSNPMAIAMFRRDVIADLVYTGHAKAAKNVLDEVDRIIATVEANHYALDEYGYGDWVFSEAKSNRLNNIYDWTPNPSPRFAALDKETDGMLDKLNELIEYVRSIGVEGVNASTEAAKVQLQVHRQDLTAAKEADAATAKELEKRPL